MHTKKAPSGRELSPKATEGECGTNCFESHKNCFSPIESGNFCNQKTFVPHSPSTASRSPSLPEGGLCSAAVNVYSPKMLKFMTLPY